MDELHHDPAAWFAANLEALTREEHAARHDFLQPWQRDFIDAIFNDDEPRPIRLWTGRGRGFAHRCVVFDMLANSERAEIHGDDLHVWLREGGYAVLMGAGAQLIADTIAEAEAISRAA